LRMCILEISAHRV